MANRQCPSSPHFYLSIGFQFWLCRRFGGILSCRADRAGLKKIKLSAIVDVAFYELELGDLPFGLSIGPRLDDRCADCLYRFRNAIAKGGNQTVASGVGPRCELVFRFASDHKMEVGNDIASSNEQGNAAFDRGDDDGLGFRQVASAGCQKAGNRWSRADADQRLCIRLVGPLPPCDPFTDDPTGTTKARWSQCRHSPVLFRLPAVHCASSIRDRAPTSFLDRKTSLRCPLSTWRIKPRL